MHLDRILPFVALAFSASKLVELAYAQVCDCQGAVASLYENSVDCNPAFRGKVCTWMYPNNCCSDMRMGTGNSIYWYSYHSASMYGIERLPDGDAGWSIGIQGRLCSRVVPQHGNGCLNQGGQKIVQSAGWDFCKDRPDVCPGSASVDSKNVSADGGCQKIVAPDVWFIREAAGQEGVPFSEGAVYRLNQLGGDVVDLDTLTVREGKIEVFREFLGTYGDGLSRAQLQAMRTLAEEDARRGVLTPKMERFMFEETSVSGRRNSCNSKNML